MSDLAFFIIAMPLAMLVFLLPMWAPHVPAYLPRSLSPAVCLAIQMLQSAKGWSFDRHYARHETGVAIWIANGSSSTGFSTKGNVSPHSMGGGNVPLNARERRLLYAAAKRCEALLAAKQLEADLVAWGNEVARYADNVVRFR